MDQGDAGLEYLGPARQPQEVEARPQAPGGIERHYVDHEELLAANGRYRQLYDKQYNFERNQFVNPGEDFTPQPEPVSNRPARISNL